MNFDDDQTINEITTAVNQLERIDVEWVTFVALRDSVGIALQDVSLASRNETMRLAENLIPVLFNRDESILRRKWESREARECREKADLLNISFSEAVQREIRELETLIKRAKSVDQAKALNSRLDSLKKINQENKDKSYYEGKLIQLDAALGANYPTPKTGEYFDFSLPSKRLMRIRLIHETAVEAINGADLIYEHHITTQKLVRISAVQYKVMQKERYIKKLPKTLNQIKRLQNKFCDFLPCLSSEQETKGQFYRLPTCAAFLRATNRLQNPNSGTISIGYYAPICRVKSLWEQGQEISARTLEGEVITHRIFEDLFNSGVLGSRLLTYDELEKLYKEQKILETDDSITMHMQVFS